MHEYLWQRGGVMSEFEAELQYPFDLVITEANGDGSM